MCESFALQTLNYQQKAYEVFVRNSQNGINENTKNGVRLIAYMICGVLCDFEMLKK